MRNMTKLWLVLLAAAVSLSSALFVEDAGALDFLVATAGHGVKTKVIFSSSKSVITSDAASSQWDPSSSCVVASRSVDDATLQWRRNVCTSKATPNHAAVAFQNALFTNDANGSVRAWTVEEGALIWDVPPTPFQQKHPRVWALSKDIVAATSAGEKGNDILTLYNVVDGRSLGSADAKSVGGSHWLYAMPEIDGSIHALVAHVSTKHDLTTGSKVTLVELSISGDTVKVGSHNKLPVDSFLVSTLQIQTSDGGAWQAVALDAKKSHLVQFSSDVHQVVDISGLHPLWTSMVSVSSTAEYGMISIIGRDNRYSPPRDSMALFRFDDTAKIWDQWYAEDGEEGTQFRGIAYCPASKLVVAVEQSGQVTAMNAKAIDFKGDSSSLSRGDRHRAFSPLTVSDVEGDTVPGSDQDAVTRFELLSCEENTVTVLITTTRGTTTQLTISREDRSGKLQSSAGWIAEEGLGQVSDALLLDATHPASVLDAVTEEEAAEALRRLSFPVRLQSQVDDILAFFSASAKIDSRDTDFGFVKVAMLLSQSANRVWGMPTSGSSRGSIAWKIDLPQLAVKHSMVHGTSSSKAEVHGINGGTHSPEVLVMSLFADSSIEWTCLDGITGEVHNSATVAFSSPVSQVVPLFGGFGMCRQLAILIHEDKSISVIPGDDNGKETVRGHIRASNTLFSHVVDRKTNVLQSFEIAEENDAFVAKFVGRTDFPGEQIVKVAYPNRDEVVQAPCHILGDDSLLLKYLNPHLAVILTMPTDTASSKQDELAIALATGGKRKPAGATPPGEAAHTEPKPVEDAPNLFVNVVDTVSGRVLHRASHSNASPDESIPVLISENWIFYAFFNEKIRRTEIGVLTLYEGMIDKNGITAFRSPDQALTFSSLEARGSKPVVLAKTYVIPKSVNALGITSTRGGISSRYVLFATGDDRIMSTPRQTLEPRRPTGEVKPSEKLEGLYQ